MSNKHHFGDKSTSIRECHHDNNTKELTIHFHSGSAHIFSGVEVDVFEALKGCDSPGKFFHSSIRNKYSNKKVG